ncbi:MAG: ABC transporter permease [Candidatus Kerfeldbacteria bacterium]
MSTIKTLTLSAMKMFVRNRQSLFFTLFMPLMIMVIFGFVGFDKVPTTKLGIVSPNPTPETTAFIDQLKQAPNMSMTFGTEQQLRDAMKKNSVAAVFVIPDNLIPAPGASSVTPATQTVTVLENVGQLQQAKTAESIMSQILDKTTIAMARAPQLFELKTEEVSVRSTKYIDFLLPGIVGMALMQMAVFSVAFVFADYKEKGILKRLLATPMKPQQFVTAQVITRLLVALAQTAILIAVGVWLLHTHVYGSIWLIALIAILGSIMFLGLGFTISGFANTVESVPAIANLIVFPMLFLGGTFFPTDGMPNWLQHIVQYLPLQYLTHGLREVMANGSGISVIAHDLYWMIGWSVVLVTLAMFTFRFEERRV